MLGVPLAHFAHNYALRDGMGRAVQLESTICTRPNPSTTIAYNRSTNPKEAMTRTLGIFAIDTPTDSFTIAAIGQTEALVAALVATGDVHPIGYNVHQVPGVTTSLALDQDSSSVILSR